MQSLANDRFQQNTGKGTTIAFQPSMFWELLDPKPCQATTVTSARNRGARPENVPDARMCITTHFVHPLVEDEAEQPVPSDHLTVATEPLLANPETLEQLSMVDLCSQLLPDDFDWLPT